jgi:hypothetical protein
MTTCVRARKPRSLAISRTIVSRPDSARVDEVERAASGIRKAFRQECQVPPSQHTEVEGAVDARDPLSPIEAVPRLDKRVDQPDMVGLRSHGLTESRPMTAGADWVRPQPRRILSEMDMHVVRIENPDPSVPQLRDTRKAAADPHGACGGMVQRRAGEMTRSDAREPSVVKGSRDPSVGPAPSEEFLPGEVHPELSGDGCRAHSCRARGGDGCTAQPFRRRRRFEPGFTGLVALFLNPACAGIHRHPVDSRGPQEYCIQHID